MHITADRSICVGAGQCVLACPEVFDQDDNDGLVVLRQEVPAEADQQAVREAVEICPSGALQLS